MATFNGFPLTEKRIASWTKAIKKAASATNIILGKGRHPQTNDRFYVVNGSHVYHVFITSTGGYRCTCEAGQNSNACYHAAAAIMQHDPALAAWLQAPYETDDLHKTQEMPVISTGAGAVEPDYSNEVTNWERMHGADAGAAERRRLAQAEETVTLPLMPTRAQMCAHMYL